MKKLPPVIFCSLLARGVFAADDGGFKRRCAAAAAKIDGKLSWDRGRAESLTVRGAKKCMMGPPSHLRSNLIEQRGDDCYSFRDKTDTIGSLFPWAVLMAGK